MTDTVDNEETAHAVLRAARDAVYRFPGGFSGFAATIEYIDQTVTARGTTRISGPSAIETEIELNEERSG